MEPRATWLKAYTTRVLRFAVGVLGPWLARVVAPALTAVLTLVVALILIFEEWGWVPLHRAMAALSRWRPVAALEAVIMRLPPYGALVAFALPVALLIPVKLGAL